MGISGVGNEKIFLYVFRQRLNDHFIQNWHQRLNELSRASFDRQISVFQFQPYLEKSCAQTKIEMLYQNGGFLHTDCILNPVVGIDLIPPRERIAYATHVIFWRMNFFSTCIYRHPSSVHRPSSVRLLTFLNDISEAEKQNFFIFYTLRERLRTHIVFTIDQYFNLTYHNFSIKSYVVGVY